MANLAALRPAALTKRRRSLRRPGDVLFLAFIYAGSALSAFLCLSPFLHTIAVAFSGDAAIAGGKVGLWPVDFQTDAMRSVLTDASVLRALGVSVGVTAGGTAFNLLLTVMTAYPLSRRDFRARGAFMNYMIVTMLFSGGMIPAYLLIRHLGLYNTVWSMILPGAISVINVIIMKTFFQELPEELREAAVVDGCGNTRYLFNVVLPLSGATLAAVGLLYAVGHWNSYFTAMLYVDNAQLHTLQVKLRNLLMLSRLDRESFEAAAIVFAAAPILFVLPFLHKYAIKGSLLGSIKS